MRAVQFDRQQNRPDGGNPSEKRQPEGIGIPV